MVRCVFFMILMALLPPASADWSDYSVDSPSFECGRASTDLEKEICTTEQLRALDKYLAFVYRLGLAADNSDNLRREQREWLKYRKECYEGNTEDRSSYYSAITPLSECYSDRISAIVTSYKIDRDIEFYKNLSEYFGFNLPGSFNSDSEEFVYFRNLARYIDGYVNWHCSYIPEKIFYDDGRILKTLIRGSTTCGGTSHGLTATYIYCNKDGDYYSASVWECGNKDVSAVRFLFDYLQIYSFQEFLASDRRNEQNNVIIDYVYSIPIHALAEPDKFRSRRRVFSDSFVKYGVSNLDRLLAIVESYEEDVLHVVKGLVCAKDMILKSEDWMRVLGNAERTGFNMARQWYGRQFEGCGQYDVRIIGQRYTEKELYVNLWAQLYNAGGFEAASRALADLQDTLEGMLLER